MNDSHKHQAGVRRAFTLIEMLVVLAIVVLLLAFSTPALMRTLQSSKLTSVGDSLLGMISQAQQTAYAFNVPVELRFFKFKELGDNEPSFHAYQLFKVTLETTGTGASAVVKEVVVPVGNLIRISEGVTISEDVKLSPALSGNGLPDTKEGGSTGYSGVEGATYNALRFMTDGSCRKVGQSTQGFATLTYQTLPECFLTVASESGQKITLDNLPKNFYTIQVDPFTGKARTYKPGF